MRLTSGLGRPASTQRWNTRASVSLRAPDDLVIEFRQDRAQAPRTAPAAVTGEEAGETSEIEQPIALGRLYRCLDASLIQNGRGIEDRPRGRRARNRLVQSDLVGGEVLAAMHA